MKFETNSQLQLAYDYLQYTNQNVFLTGKAGTGKTTFLHNLRKNTPKRMVVVAPTGVAAINAGGVTIHSFFQISFGPQIPHDPNQQRQVGVSADGSVAAGIKRFNHEKINIIRSLDLLVIDEISMVRADLLDAIDEVLRRFKNRYQPFGGIQLLMIGDLQQLSPVVKDDEWEILKPYYETCYFFSSLALKKSNFVGIELNHIFRQKDQRFINLLNQVRENRIDEATLKLLNERYIPGFEPDDNQGFITLTTHNYQSQQINDSKLERIKSKKFFFSAIVEGEFPEYSYPTDAELILKQGAQVMFVKNDSSQVKRYYNGKIGKITAIDDDIVKVLCPGETEPIVVEPVEWQNCKYALNEKTQEIDELVIGKFIQFPLKLAWAITIHKSQGLTFEKAIIDAQMSFAHGQVYVALSRCKTLEGMVLRSRIGLASVRNDQTVLRFTSYVEQNQPGPKDLIGARQKYQLHLLVELFDFKPLLRSIQFLLSRWNEEASSLQGNIRELFLPMLLPVQKEMIEVAEKFHSPLQQMLEANPNAEENVELQERVKKGCVYFSEKLKIIIEEPFNKATFQTDNKAVRKTIVEALEKAEKEIFIKRSCLDTVRNGFLTRTYLEARAKSALDQPSTERRKTSVTELSSVHHPEFYKKLLRWRDEKAETLNVEISKVMRQATLLDIAQTLPVTVSDLKAIGGMGGKKLKQFGKEILKLVAAYRKEKGFELPSDVEKEIAHAGLTTQQLSYELFRNCRNISEVAAKRGLAFSTIAGHLSEFVASGELDVFELIDQERYHSIADFLLKNKAKTLGEIRTELGDKFEYWEIKLVSAHLRAHA